MKNEWRISFTINRKRASILLGLLLIVIVLFFVQSVVRDNSRIEQLFANGNGPAFVNQAMKLFSRIMHKVFGENGWFPIVHKVYGVLFGFPVKKSIVLGIVLQFLLYFVMGTGFAWIFRKKSKLWLLGPCAICFGFAFLTELFSWFLGKSFEKINFWLGIMGTLWGLLIFWCVFLLYEKRVDKRWEQAIKKTKENKN